MKKKQLITQVPKCQVMRSLSGRNLKPYESRLNHECWTVSKLNALTKKQLIDYMIQDQRVLGEAADELCHMVWYNRHLALRQKIEEGKETCDPEIWKGALKCALKEEKKYGRKNLGPYSTFDWGMMNGKLSAIRWMMGEDWDELYT